MSRKKKRKTKNSDAEGTELSALMTVRDVAEYLLVSESTIYKWISKGVIPGFKIGDSWRIPKEKLMELIGEKMAMAIKE